ncbi:hypothetical protein QZH41_001283 [Actinostola sp. cb2023]|nr:hypothetical protein QZH41_001283 [Actinostola sp. cb2023]
MFNTCNQNSFAVASILEHLFYTIKQEYPTIRKAFLRSDNAGCYHNSFLLLALSDIGEKTGIKPLRYDFSDPQAGKDICDRKTAPMKAHMKRWVSEKHDILTAEDMKQALESHGGLKGCRAAVVEVDPSREVSNSIKIPGISLLNNFSFEETGIRAWKTYNVGPGRMLMYSEFKIQTQDDICLKVVEPFGALTKERGTVGESSRQTAEIFSCRETGCVLTFKTEAEAEAHMDTGKHSRELESESVYDSIRKKWASTVTGISLGTRYTVPEENKDLALSSTSSHRQAGWALKTSKRPSRMSTRAKAFLTAKFDEGVKSGHKADPVQLCRGVIEKKYESLSRSDIDKWIRGQQKKIRDQFKKENN